MTKDRSRAALIKFLDFMANKGLAPANTVNARKAAANKILGILNDEEASDISNLDLASLMARFSNLNGHDYTPASLTTYQSRLKSSIEDFFAYQENPLTFKPSGKQREKAVKIPSSKDPTSGLSSERGAPPDDAVTRQPHPTALSSLTLPIPLRANLTVQIHGLPFDLTKSEANKIAAVISAFSNE